MTGTASGTIPAAELLQAYRTMRTIRDFEERVYKEFQTGQMPGGGRQAGQLIRFRRRGQRAADAQQ